MSEFVLKIKVPIKELLISASNSYFNNREYLKPNFTTKCERYRTGIDNHKYMP